jgi:hypothetical protein
MHGDMINVIQKRLTFAILIKLHLFSLTVCSRECGYLFWTNGDKRTKKETMVKSHHGRLILICMADSRPGLTPVVTIEEAYML